MHWLLLLALSVLPGPPLQQTTEEVQVALETERPKLELLQDDTSEEASAWRAAYEERIKLLEELLSTEARLEALPDAAELEQRATDVQAEIAEAEALEAPTSVTLADAGELKAYEQRATTAQAERFSAAATLTAQTTRHSEAAQELAGLGDRSSRTSTRVEALTGDDDISRYRLETGGIESSVISARATFLTAGLPLWEQEGVLLGLRAELKVLAEERAKALAVLAQAEATRLREAEAEVTRREAEAAARRAARERDPVVRLQLRFSAEAGNLQAKSKSFETTLLELANRVTRERESLRDVAATRDALESRLRLGARGADRMLLQHLERNRRSQQLIREHLNPELYDDYELNQIELAEVLDRVWNLALPEDENAELAEFLTELPPERQDEALEAFRGALEDDGLADALRQRADQLEDAAGEYAALVQALDERASAHAELDEYILGRMLWTRSDAPLNTRTLAKGLAELRSLPEPYRQDHTWQRFVESLASHVPVLMIAAGALLALIYLTRRLAGWRTFGANQGPVARHALRWGGGLVWAAAPSGALWCLAWALFSIHGPDAFDPPVTTLLIYQGHFLLTRRLVRALLAEGGLLVGPQTFPPGIGAQLSRAVAILTIAGQAFFAPYMVLAGAPFKFVVVPRILFTAWSFGASIAVLTLLRRKGALIQTWTREGRLLRTFLRAMAILASVSLVPVIALDVLGYRVGAERTLLNGLKVLSAMFVVGALFRLVEGIGLYWAQRAAGAESEEDQRLIEARGVGIRAMVRVGAYAIAFIGAMYLKSALGISGPLIKLMAGWQLLNLGPDGAGVEQWLTGWDVLVALMWLLGGHLLASNLRTLHRSLMAPFTGEGNEGTQYAFLAILRYLLLLVAYGVALLKLGFSFATLGMFVTAASVGLGFGLQEIVANFISGLILLFERPIRVGDIVTIGTTSGKVESIAIRATVITNWQRQTIIVPNKKFITEELTNWTRTDKVMRRDFIVRVAYGTDIERVKALLVEVLGDHPAVLKEPAPGILFQEFGTLGLEFQVLFYTAISHGLGTRSELHALINTRFAEEGIEIPFVQRLDGPEG